MGHGLGIEAADDRKKEDVFNPVSLKTVQPQPRYTELEEHCTKIRA